MGREREKEVRKKGEGSREKGGKRNSIFKIYFPSRTIRNENSNKELERKEL